MIKDACVIIPVFNEATVVREVVSAVCRQFKYVVVVTDGSRDNSPAEVAKTKALLIQHPINIGQGGALQTGLAYAKKYMPGEVRYFVTFDGDGQHRLSDAVKMVERLRGGRVDVVLGSRFLTNRTKLKPTKRLMLKLGTRFSNRMSGLRLTDTHNGLRAFNRRFADALTITRPDMSHASEIVDTIAVSGVRWVEMPVTIDYTKYSLSKGQSLLNSVNIGFDVILNRLAGKR